MMDPKKIRFIGDNLVRPECVLCTARGDIYVSDFRGGVTQVTPAGEQIFFGGEKLPDGEALKPNGIALLPNGDFLIAHLGDSFGGVYRLSRDNRLEPFLKEVNGTRLPPTNFVYLDHQGRIWITVSTRMVPRAKAYRSDIADGYIVVLDDTGARIVADNLGYTNEVTVSPCGNYLYANATFAQETLRFTIRSDNALVDKKTVAQYSGAVFPDGLTMDSDGCLWVTSIVSNRVIRLDPETGSQTIFLEDADKCHTEEVAAAFKAHRMARPHLDQNPSQYLRNISSLAFSGTDLSTMVLGCLLGSELAVVESDYQGIPPAHWHFEDAQR